MNIFKFLFKNPNKKPPPIVEEVSTERYINDLKQFDDVWIKVNSNIFDGWVTERDKNTVYIVYTNENNKLDEAVFTIDRPLNRTKIEQKDKILYLTKQEAYL